MVVALFTVVSGVERARRQNKPAAALDLLQVIAASAASAGMRPSDIATQRFVHPSLVTRQLRDLEDAGYLQFAADPDDGRSLLVTLTPAGRAEMLRLQDVGLDRFSVFVADWEAGEVRHLAGLLDKLTTSMASVADQEGPPARRERRARRLASRHDQAGRP
jgi:DNA-binding MarR family transcriptional regulator